MTANDLLLELRRRGVELVVCGDRLRFRPADAVGDLLPAMKAHKPALLAALAGRPSTPTRGTRWLTGVELDGLDEPLSGLVCRREGWTPASWASYLRRRADGCDELHADVAGRYRRAADLIDGDVEKTRNGA